MAIGKVAVHTVNDYQSSINEVERKIIFIGSTTDAGLHNIVIALDAGTDLDMIFESDPDSVLYPILLAAQTNGKSNWTAAFVGINAGDDWTDALDIANKIGSFEVAVICDPITKKEDYYAGQVKMMSVQAVLARYMFAILTVPAIDSEPTTGQTWAEYITLLSGFNDDVLADRVMAVPLLFGNATGIIAGRLCDRTVTVADSPMRVKTGPLLGLGPIQFDKDGVEMPDTIFETLDALRFSVPQNYPGEVGMFWADGNMLDADNGDYKVVENLRVVLKACRLVYPLAVKQVGDRRVNSSPTSIKQSEQLFMRPLRSMSAPVRIAGADFPGEIYPPEPGAISINWLSQTDLKIYITLRPYNSPKNITVGIGLDLTTL